LLGCAADTPIEIWFQDEARVRQKGTHAYIWPPVGLRPRMVRDHRHDSAYLFGAICSARGVGAAIIMPAANAQAMNKHLAEINARVMPGAHAVMLCDQAGWHQTGGKLRLPANITLLPLPAYSPEPWSASRLKPMENVCHYLCSNKLCTLIWDSYEAIIDACSNAWNFLINDPGRITAIGRRERACVNPEVDWYNITSFPGRCLLDPAETPKSMSLNAFSFDIVGGDPRTHLKTVGRAR